MPNRKLQFWILVLCLCFVCPGATRADHKANVEKLLQANYDKSDMAFSSNNIEAYLAVYSPDYVGFDDTGDVLIPNKSALRRAEQHQLTIKRGSKVSKIHDITVHGNQAIVIVQSDYTPKGKLSEGNRHYDLWQKIKNHWLIKQCHPLD